MRHSLVVWTGAVAAAVAVAVVWWALVMTELISRTGVAELLGVSLALNAGLLIVLFSRYRSSGRA